MLCFSNLKKSLFLSLLFSFFVLSFSLVINVADSFASNHSYTYSSDTNVSAGRPVVPDCSTSDCLSQYRYITSVPSAFSYGNTIRTCYYKSFTINNSSTLRNSFVCGFFYNSIQIAVRDSSGLASFVFDGSYTIPSGTTFILSYDPPSFTSAPTGNIDITANGTYDVTNYASATVNIENEIIYGDYHNDLININNSILICGAICLVLYFFYSIYRLIIKSSGGS